MYFVSKTESYAKLFFVISFSGIVMYVILATYSLHTAYGNVSEIDKSEARVIEISQSDPNKIDRSDNDLKYILLWSTKNKPSRVEQGQKVFIANNCSYLNCFVTTNKNLLNGDYTHFDAIVFNMSIVDNWRAINLPEKRSPHQKYVFHSMLPSNENPICTEHLDNYFNWTWSYKLYSDIVTTFLEVKDLEGNVVSPGTDVQWPKYEHNHTQDVVTTKSKPVALLMVNCKPNVYRTNFVKKLQYFFKERGLVVDVYGCNCLKEDCMKRLEKSYYFYIVYEDSKSEDYVTKEVLSAYDNYAVPILIGGADYSKFLPEGSYIEAGTNYQELAAVIDYLIRNPAAYNAYHEWRLKYTIHGVKTSGGYCDLCGLLNDNKRFEAHSTYETFRKWWFYGSLKERCYVKGAERFSEVLSYINSTEKRRRLE